MDNGTPVILHLRGSEFFGSPEKLIAGQMKHLKNFHSICASFVKRKSSNEFLAKMQSLGLRTASLEERSRFDPGIIRRLRRLMDSTMADMLVTHEYKSNFYGHYACKRAGIPQIVYFHGWTAEDIKVRLYNMIDRHVIKTADKVITVSRATAGKLADAGVPASTIEVVYNAIELDGEATYLPKDRNEIPVIGMIGRLSYEKGAHILLRALNEIKTRAPGFTVRIYGDGPESGRLQAMAADMKLTEIVSFEGFRRDLDEIYPALDLIVLPSLSEGHPLVILEAWKHGIGIIASRAGGVPEVVEDGRNGILVEVNDYRGLGEAILAALGNIELIRQYGRAGHEDASQKFNFKRQSEQLEQIYRETLDNYHAKRD